MKGSDNQEKLVYQIIEDEEIKVSFREQAENIVLTRY